MRATRFRPPLLAALLLAACASSGIELGESFAATSDAPRSIVERAVAAHGGNLFEEVCDLSVSSQGEWSFLAPSFQPVMADKRYRKAPEERYHLAQGVIFQRHVFAHRWRLTGLDTDRGLEPSDLSGEGLSGRAAVPAAELEPPGLRGQAPAVR